ncbi:ankyrin repeat domain-containing protein [Legionella hackeliae]|uniref:Uncharacterized protein n=2 Tax=Legionella hackeliae TaxID=449 RepID=A0A0A8URK7_LEGHA|nr:ankyrin repeat domain-containing protein [Legionella hackeliae]KTD11212.1 Ankyrin repeats (3 copies) [Legionella hackeliae]CEK11383.1 protein of unknown function [ankyrin repeat] [Legionella hackeliae]STX48155.1 Ankyrin repeats (3 copies) [Legionella hackeliae]
MAKDEENKQPKKTHQRMEEGPETSQQIEKRAKTEGLDTFGSFFEKRYTELEKIAENTYKLVVEGKLTEEEVPSFSFLDVYKTENFLLNDGRISNFKDILEGQNPAIIADLIVTHIQQHSEDSQQIIQISSYIENLRPIAKKAGLEAELASSLDFINKMKTLSAANKLSQKGDFGQTLLHFFAAQSHHTAMLILIEAGAALNAPTENGTTPIHLLFGDEQTFPDKYPSNDFLQKLIDYGADFSANAIDDIDHPGVGITPLDHLASAYISAEDEESKRCLLFLFDALKIDTPDKIKQALPTLSDDDRTQINELICDPSREHTIQI